jgi:hypothetical protein
MAAMAGIIRKIALVGLAAGLSAAGWAQAPGQGPGKPRTARPVVKSPMPAAAQPQVAPQPLGACVPPTCTPPQPVYPPRPEQMTPVAPQVTYQNGLLSIQAQNSTLSSILSAVHARTGARVDMPADTANDRAAAQLGPGNPRDVLASLLQGSRFDYIFIGSPTDPDALLEVILTPHAGSSGAAPGNEAANQQPGGSRLTMPRVASSPGPPEINGDEEETAAEPQPVFQPPPPQQVPQPGVTGAEQQPPSLAVTPGVEPGQQGKPGEVKTPEQLLRDLQRMQQQQQQGKRTPQQD